VSILRLPETDSTNLEARRLIARGERGPKWIIAGRQTAGRGRLERAWVSPPGNLYTSLILRPGRPLRDAACLSLLSGLAVHQTLAGFLPDIGVELKWPNDVLAGGAKIAGILLESEGDPQDPTLIIGIGINVADAPGGLPYPATSLAAEGGETDLETLFKALRGNFERLWTDFQADGFGPIRARWQAAGPAIGTALEARLANKTLAGTFGGLDESGALLLVTAEGPIAIHAGDVFFAPDQVIDS